MDTEPASPDRSEPSSAQTGTEQGRAASPPPGPAVLAVPDETDEATIQTSSAGPARPAVSEATGGKDRKRAASHSDAAGAAADTTSRTGSTAETPLSPQAIAVVVPDQAETPVAGGGAARSGQASAGPVHAGHGAGTERATPDTDPAVAGAAPTPGPVAADFPSSAPPAPTPDAAANAASPTLQQAASLPAATAGADAAAIAHAAGTATRQDGVAGGDSGTPMAQLTGPAVSLLRATDGSSSLSVSLHPKDLGEVRIRLDRDAGGTVRVVVAATEPGTLRSLMADQSHLHAALDAASLPTGDRQVSFELDGASSAGGSGAQDQAAARSGTGNDAAGGGERSRDGQSRAWDGYGSDSGMTGTEDGAIALPAFVAARAGSYRPGINITA